MKMITKTSDKNAGNTPILIAYWFNSNRHNPNLFESLSNLRERIPPSSLRIVCINPFNSPEDIDQFKQQFQLDFEMIRDEKNTALFYQVNTFPTLLLMEQNGRILNRSNGISEDALDEIENTIIRSRIAHETSPASIVRKVNPPLYKENLLMQFKKI